jgi:hypothetical protein
MAGKRTTRADSNRMPLISFRLPSDEYDFLQKVVESFGESMSEFVRNAVVLRLGGGTVEVSSGGTAEVTIHTPGVAGRKTGSVASFKGKSEGQTDKGIFQVSS